ncbi:MAG: LamB/YcsF family protein [Bacteroidetes bacterium]|nr:MAG: LamB/YcsF family protein [Bacteroidota bacterium]
MNALVDINCDMGESFGAWALGNDEALMPWIHSANIACGFHAGDPGVMARTVSLALKHGIQIGAHPGLPDIQGFGRREMSISPQEAYDMTLYQIGALDAIVRAKGGILQHVKPHGALYNLSARQAEIAKALAQAVCDADPSLILYGLSGSISVKIAAEMGLAVKHEVFADRTYQSNGALTPRSHPKALISHPEEMMAQAEDLLLRQQVCSVDGEWIVVRADTICVHGDGPHALQFAKMLYERFALA